MFYVKARLTKKIQEVSSLQPIQKGSQLLKNLQGEPNSICCANTFTGISRQIVLSNSFLLFGEVGEPHR